MVIFVGPDCMTKPMIYCDLQALSVTSSTYSGVM